MTVTPVDLRTDTRRAPRGIGFARPELAWRLPAGAADQSAYQAQVATGDDFRAGALVWDSGRVDSPRQFGVRPAEPGWPAARITGGGCGCGPSARTPARGAPRRSSRPASSTRRCGRPAG